MNSKKISAFLLAMITIAYVASIRSLPTAAKYGFSCMFYYLAASLVFLVPTALISAELASGWPGRGGIYLWVREALGEPWDFLAIWLQFLSNIAYFPAFLAFVAATFAYIFFPQLATNKYFLISLILILFWGFTLISFRGMNMSGWISTACVLLGIFIPILIIIICSVVWLAKGGHSQIVLSWQTFFPQVNKLHLRDLAFLGGLIYSLSGMEVSGAHALDLKNVRSFAKAIFLATILIFATTLGALSIALIVPQAKISLVAGIMQTATMFFTEFHLQWAVPLFAGLLVFGACGKLLSSIIGPSKGLFGSAVGGVIPPILCKVNKHNMPHNMLIFQGIIVTILALIFLLMPTASSSFWLLTAMVTIIYLAMYILLFVAALVLRYKQPQANRTYRVPGGKLGIWMLTSIGLASTIFSLFISFLPPSQIYLGGIWEYEILLTGGIIVLVGMGWLIYTYRKPKWAQQCQQKPRS